MTFPIACRGKHIRPAPLFAAVDKTGATDVTAAVQTIINGIANGTVLYFPVAPAVLRIDGTLNVDARSNIKFDGNGCELIQVALGGLSRCFWSAENSTGCRWTGFTMTGANANAGLGDAAQDDTRGSQHGWHLLGCINCRVDHNDVSMLYADFVSMYKFQTGDQHHCSGTRIDHNTFVNNGRQGINGDASDDCEVDHNAISGIRRGMFDFEPNTDNAGCDTWNVHDNTFGSHRLQFIAASGGNGAAILDNLTFANNTISGGTGSEWTLSIDWDPPQVDSPRRNNLTFVNNVASGVAGSGGQVDPPSSQTGNQVMSIAQTDGVTITGNTQPMQLRGEPVHPMMYLAEIIDCTTVNVTGNTIVNGVDQIHP